MNSVSLHANLLIIAAASLVGSFLPIVNFETQMNVTGCIMIVAKSSLALLCLLYQDKTILLAIGFYFTQGIAGFNLATSLLTQLKFLFEIGS